MRCLAVALALVAWAPVAAAATVPLAVPAAAPLPDAPTLPLPVVEAAPAPVPVRVVVDAPAERVVLHADLPPLPLVDAPGLHVAKQAHARPRDAAPALAALAERRADRALAAPARLAPAVEAPAPAPREAEPPAAAPAPAEDAATPPAPGASAVAFAAAEASGGWTRAAALAGALVLLLAPLALYHRLRGARTLEQSTRARLFALLRERPGVTIADAARALDVDPKTAHYHLLRLVKEGLVLAEGPARRARYFAAGSVPAHERGALVAASASRGVLDAVLRAPGLTKTQLAGALGVARPTLNWHLRRLAQAGLVRCERDGRGVRVLPRADPLPKPLNSQAL